MTLAIKKRRGFLKIAIENGADLVPVIHFGELSTYKVWRPPEDSWFNKMVDKSYEKFGLTFSLFKGRCKYIIYMIDVIIIIIIAYSISHTDGILPFRKPIKTVGKFCILRFCSAKINFC